MRRIRILATLGIAIVLSSMTTPALAAPSSYLRHTFYGSNNGDRSYGVAIDSEDCSIIVGRSFATWEGPSGEPPLHEHAEPGGGAADIFVLKLDADGEYLWHTFYGTATAHYHAEPADYGMGVTIDSDDNIYVTGFSASTWTGPSAEAPLHAYSNGIGDACVLKLAPSGDYEWHTFYGSGTGDADLRDEGHYIAIDGDDNIYVAMKTGGTWTGPSAEAPIHAYTGNKDIAVLKLSDDGDYRWHSFFGSDAADDGSSIAVDGNDVYVAAVSGASWDAGDPPLNGHSGGNDIAVIKLDDDGNYQWHTFFGSSASDGANGVVARSGNVYVTGYSVGTWDGPDSESPLNDYAGAADMVTLKLDESGDFKWHTFDGSAGSDDFGLCVALSRDGSRVCVTGRSLATWSESGDKPVHAYAGDADILVLELNKSGDYQWHTLYGSDKQELGQHLALDSRGYIHVAGAGKGSWLGDDDAEPMHEYTGDQDIVELVLGEVINPPEKTIVEEKERKERRVEPASLGLSYLMVDPVQVLPGQGVTISANVCNSGGERGSHTATLSVNGVAEQSQSLGVSAGSCQQVLFTVSRAVPGTYQVSIDGMTGQFTVLAPRTVQASVPSQQDTGLGTAGIIAIVAVGIALIAALAMLFRRD